MQTNPYLPGNCTKAAPQRANLAKDYGNNMSWGKVSEAQLFKKTLPAIQESDKTNSTNSFALSL